MIKVFTVAVDMGNTLSATPTQVCDALRAGLPNALEIGVVVPGMSNIAAMHLASKADVPPRGATVRKRDLRDCRICGFCVDISMGHVKPDLEWSTRGRAHG